MCHATRWGWRGEREREIKRKREGKVGKVKEKREDWKWRRSEEESERSRENAVETSGTSWGQRSCDSHGTLSYLPDRRISSIILGYYPHREKVIKRNRAIMLIIKYAIKRTILQATVSKTVIIYKDIYELSLSLSLSHYRFSNQSANNSYLLSVTVMTMVTIDGILISEDYNDSVANKDLYEKDEKIVGPWMRTFNLRRWRALFHNVVLLPFDALAVPSRKGFAL